MRPAADEIHELWESFRKGWQTFSENLKNLRLPENLEFDLDTAEPQEKITFPAISKNVLQCHDYIDALASSESYHSIPNRSVSRIRTLIEEANKQLQDTNGKFSQAAEADGFAKFDADSLAIATSDDVIKIDLGALYRYVFEKLDNLIYEYSVISHFLKVDDETPMTQPGFM